MAEIETFPTPPEIVALKNQLASVRDLPRIRNSNSLSLLVGGAGMDPCPEPTFRRLFTHQTWRDYTGIPALSRWRNGLRYWRHSSVLHAVWPPTVIVFGWALAVSKLLPHFVPFFTLSGSAVQQQLPLSLQGAAIGLLLVFRTNNAFQRLEEARGLWSQTVCHTREIMMKAAATWNPAGGGGGGGDSTTTEGLSTTALCDVCRYLCAYIWSLRDQLRDGEDRGDILERLLPPREASWLSLRRDRPVAVLGRLRRLLHRELVAGTLSSEMHYLLEMDVKELDAVSASCERLFSSPIPPTMSRHGMRSLTLWLLALPVVLACGGANAHVTPIANACWCAATAYIYVGIDELGAQVEQPFTILPLWQICHAAQAGVEEALSVPEMPLDILTALGPIT